MKSLTMALTAAATAVILGASAMAADKKAAPNVRQLPDGYTQEIRYTTAPIAGKTAIVTKLIITRDPSGRVVSVKRG